MTNEIMTLEEVAAYLRVSERTVTDWATKGELPGGKLGTSWRFKRMEIERWVNGKLTPRIPVSFESTRPLTSLFSRQRIALLSCSSKNDALNAMIDLSVSVPGVLSRGELADAVFKREELMSTGIGLGIAVPHVRLGGVQDIYLTVGINDEGIADYESLDNQPVRILVLIIAGRNQHAQYIQTLSQISRFLKLEKVRDELYEQKDAEGVYNFLNLQGAMNA